MLSTQLISSCLVSVLLVVLYCDHGLGTGASHNEKCEVGLTADHRQLDTCDREKNLVCQHERCVCQDQANQIWSARLVKVNSRSKRGSKKGKIGAGKAILAGAAAGAAGGYIGGKLAQAGSSSSGSSGSSGGKRKEQYQAYYACHSRVGGQCVLDAYKNVIININKPAEVQQPAPVTTTTTAAPAGPGSNETTTSTTAAPAPVAAAQTSVAYDFSTMTVPKCVEYAECKTSTVKIVNGTVVSQVSSDQRLGSCTCKEGYKADSRDICVKANGVGQQTQISLFLLFVAALVSFSSK